LKEHFLPGNTFTVLLLRFLEINDLAWLVLWVELPSERIHSVGLLLSSVQDLVVSVSFLAYIEHFISLLGGLGALEQSGISTVGLLKTDLLIKVLTIQLHGIFRALLLVNLLNNLYNFLVFIRN
jgi:hypothetical protein